MTLETKLNGARLAPLYPPITLDDRPRNEVSIQSLCATIDRLTALVERLLERETAQAAPVEQARLKALTSRELEVARLIVEGLSSKEICRRLTLSEYTINSHRRNITRKVGTSSRTGLRDTRAQWEVEAGTSSGRTEQDALMGRQ